jgi:hypothetical protein
VVVEHDGPALPDRRVELSQLPVVPMHVEVGHLPGHGVQEVHERTDVVEGVFEHLLLSVDDRQPGCLQGRARGVECRRLRVVAGRRAQRLVQVGEVVRADALHQVGAARAEYAGDLGGRRVTVAVDDEVELAVLRG